MPGHTHEASKHYQSASTARAKVLQNLEVRRDRYLVWCQESNAKSCINKIRIKLIRRCAARMADQEGLLST